jgi:hypothetical protein
MGDLLAWSILAAIMAAACATTALVTTRAYEAIKRRGWSEPATALATFGVGSIVFGFGWLWIDIWWGLKALGRGAKWAWASAR